jgi:hypothetical protein
METKRLVRLFLGKTLSVNSLPQSPKDPSQRGVGKTRLILSVAAVVSAEQPFPD